MSLINNSDVLQQILVIQAGNTQAREDFINEYKPFIAKTTMNLCKRLLNWEDSDELSIALIAFNSAIDSYDHSKRVPFLPYAKVVIENRLKDYFRKTARIKAEYPLESETDEGLGLSEAEIQSAWKDFQDRTIEDERREELEEYEELLSGFGINFESLLESSPKHRDSRDNLFKVADYIVNNKDLMEYLLSKKQLPITDLAKRTGLNRKTLERGRKFIIATVLVIYYKMKFLYISSYINLGSHRKGDNK